MRKRKSCIVEIIVLITCIWLMVVGAHAEITLPFTSQQPVSTLQASSDVVFNTDEGTYTVDGITFGGGNRIDAGQNSPYSGSEYMVHDFASINIPAGVTVTALGSSPLILTSSGDVTISGIVDVSGHDGGPGAIGMGLGAGSRAGGGGGGGGGVVGIFAGGSITLTSSAQLLARGGAGGIGGDADLAAAVGWAAAL